MNIRVENKKKDFAERLRDIANDFLNYIENEFPDRNNYFFDKIQDTVLDLLNVEKPRVMVYGIYNSGKSTLINALCRDEVAEVADRPMTDQIREYDKGDYLLIDSPGVDAPIEHEKVTEEFLNKCHIILFVISSKGIFEDRDNYKRLASLIEKELPFIIVLNERGAGIQKDWTNEQKKRAKFEHEQELKIIQYKIIQNLIKESNNSDIDKKYEIIVLNAKEAMIGILKDKPLLLKKSNIAFLEKRINQFIQNDTSIAQLFKQPISNMKECISEVEKMITQTLVGDTSEDFGREISTLTTKYNNIIEDLKILTRQSVNSHLEELITSYVMGNSNNFEMITELVFSNVENKYQIKLNELYDYVDHSFKSLNFDLDVNTSKLNFNFLDIQKKKFTFNEQEMEEDNSEEDYCKPEKRSIFDFFKSRERREEEKFNQLKREVELKNKRAEYKVQEQIRKRQEARQFAESDLNELFRVVNDIVMKAMQEKYEDIIEKIQEINELNQKAKEDGRRQMEQLKKLRNSVSVIENSLA